ncbi:ABC transporter ATP-binding protein [Alteromonas sp. C1M14]|uniref:ABC transporter ATP-binding protein n=1 Tax=Alteromonas sp. C1M14 TaxID=2841567 RepID=UPI001C098FD0|nr:ABC transporter ATP-binding protein [Alteromonas sp. C1M14]MBU2977714.1 ABC transporter ATP-binding protein/permease [Alteromonas sp. C1M14]
MADMWRRSLYFGKNIFRNYRASFVVIFVILFLETAVSLAIPYLIGEQSAALVDNDFASPKTLSFYLLIWCALFGVQSLLKFMSTYRLNVLGARLVANLSCRLYDHIQILPLRYFQHTNKGDVLSLLTHDLGTVSFYVTAVLTTLLPNILILLGSIFMMYMIEPLVAFMIMTLIPIVYLVSKFVGRQIHPLAKQIVQKQADTLAIASENISTIALIKTFNREKTESARYAHRTGEVLSLRTRQFRYQALLSPLIQFLTSVCIIAIIGVCLIQFEAGKIAVPDIVSLLLYGMIFTRPVSALAGLYGQTMQMTGAMGRLLHVHGSEREPSDNGLTPLRAQKGEITVENVSFSYQTGGTVLNQVSCNIKAGQTVLIVGENGAGKSTLLHLLMRFHRPQSGAIFIDQQDISCVTTASVRDCIGHVPQDVVLCNGTILDNITYGVAAKPSSSYLNEVCARAGLLDIVSSLPAGMATLVGEGGVRLSGGQRQRIALARALLKAPKILLFDEPTSMLDEVGRNQFKDEFDTLFKHYTVLMISHDPTLADVADRVFMLDKHQLVERT